MCTRSSALQLQVALFNKQQRHITLHFDPKKSVEFEIFTVRQVRGYSGETMNMYQSHVQQLAATCEFTNVDKEIKIERLDHHT